MTSHPKDLSDDLVAVVAELPTVCEHVHLPLQSGSDTVLAAMRRAYTAGEAIGEDDFLFLRALGVPLRQFYGQTENCALCAAQSADASSYTPSDALSPAWR